MNHKQIAKINMYKKMLLFFANPLYSPLWDTFVRLKDEISNFVQLNTKLAAHEQQHLANTKGITQTKNDAFSTMVNLVVRAARKAYVWAFDMRDENHLQIFDVQQSDLILVAESEGYAKAKNVRDALAANIGSMASVELSHTDILAINTAITAYEATIGTTGTAKAHKMAGTQGIDEHIHPIDQSLDLIDRLLETHYATTHPDMVKEYKLNRTVEKLPTHHNGINLHLTDAHTGADIEGATLAANGKISTTDIDGRAEIIKTKAGTANVTVIHPDFAPHSTKIDILSGKITELEVALAKK